MIIKYKMGDTEDFVELYEFNQPQGTIPVVMKWLNACGHFSLLFDLLVVIEKWDLVDINCRI